MGKFKEQSHEIDVTGLGTPSPSSPKGFVLEITEAEFDFTNQRSFDFGA